MLINPFFDKFRAKVNECAPQKRAAECLPPVKYWVSRHCSAIITAVGTLRSRSATSCAVVSGVSLGMLSTRPSRPTKVEEPPPSRLIASTHPSEIILSASSGSVIPALPRLLRPSQTTMTSFPSSVAPMAVRGCRASPCRPPQSKISFQ